MSTILFVGADRDVATRLQATSARVRGKLQVLAERWPSAGSRDGAPRGIESADVLLLDLTDPDAPGIRTIAALQSLRPNLPTVFLTSKSAPQPIALERLLSRPSVDFVRVPADAEEMLQRIQRLLRLTPARAGRRRGVLGHMATPSARPANDHALGHLVCSLHSPETGRLHAGMVADFFCVPLASVARALGKSLSPVHKTPDAPSLQNGLASFERVAASLLALTGSADTARVWVNAPNPELAGATPLSVLLGGHGDTVADLLDDVLLGQPA